MTERQEGRQSVGRCAFRNGQRMPSAQSGAGDERSGLHGQLEAGVRTPEIHPQLSGVHLPGLPGAL